MSQQIRVLQCVECRLYQVDIVKKSNKWECKVCNFKQMVQNEFFRGSGAECRTKVQQLNLEQGQRQHAREKRNIFKAHENEECGSNLISVATRRASSERTNSLSKWAEYIDEPPAQGMVPPRKLNTEKEFNEIENYSSKEQGGSKKRKAAQNFVAINKSSKWQNFV